MSVRTHDGALVTTDVDTLDRDDPKDVKLCGEIGRKLWEHYPDWDWGVEIPPDNQNVVIVRNVTCDPRGNMGMVCHKDKLDPALQSVVRAGGEFLERYNMRRGRFREEEIDGRQMIFEKPEQ